jgi:hypothetical protein
VLSSSQLLSTTRVSSTLSRSDGKIHSVVSGTGGTLETGLMIKSEVSFSPTFVP